MRKVELERKTKETDIKLSLDLDGKGNGEINTSCAFFDHMLTLFKSHSGYDLDVYCKGDVEVDYHHTVEDIGIVLGNAFSKALGDKKGIIRYGDIILPMDEALIMCAVDICGRDTLRTKLEIPAQKIGSFDTELVEEFLLAFTRNAKVALHVRQLDGVNSHHIVEGVFKALGRVLGAAVATDEKRAGEIPSTKGVIA